MLHVAFRYGETKLFAQLVYFFRGGDSAHVEVAELLGDGIWRCTSSSYMDKGPRAKDMPLPASKWRLYKTDIDPVVAHEWLARNKGKGYAWWKLLRFVFPWIRPSFGGPPCSQCWAHCVAIGHSDSWDLRNAEAATAWRYERVQ